MKVSLFGRIASYLILSGATLIALFPIYWTFITSLRDRVDIFAQVPVFFGGNLSFDNWVSVAGDPVFLNALLATIMVTVIATVLTVFAGTLAAYAIVRSPKFIGRTSFSSWLIVIRAVPGVVLAVPLYQIVVAPRPDFRRGSSTLVKILNWLAPSIRADSSICTGIP